VAGCVQAVRDVVVDEDDPEQREQAVHAEKAKQREKSVASADMGGCADRGSDETEDEPGLTTNFSSHQAGRGGDVKQRPTEQETPENQRAESSLPRQR